MLKELLLVALAVICLSDAVHVTNHTADMDFLDKQKKIYELFFYIKQNALTDAEFYNVGRNYHIENNIDMYNDKATVQQFVGWYRWGMLESNAIFSSFNDDHRAEMKMLFKMFYTAKDFQTFYKTAAWARLHLNDGVFTNALMAAVFFRPDCKYIRLPPLYEIYPNLFFESNVIQEARRIKMTRGSRGLSTTSSKDNIESYMVYSNYSGAYVERYFDNDYKLDYFMEDAGLNAFYYYVRQVFPLWLNSKDYNMPMQMRGSMYLYLHQQLMARYFLERISNDMGEIEEFDWNKPFYPGYYSSLMFSNGLVMPQRNCFYTVPSYKYSYLKEVKTLEMRIMNAIDSGFVKDSSGKQISIYTPEGTNILGNILEGNSDSLNKNFYGMYDILSRSIFGDNNIKYNMNKNKFIPTALQMYSTSMRDPAFYRIYNRILMCYNRYKNRMPAYDQNDLAFPMMKIKSVEMDKLITFFDYCDTVINNAVYVENFKEGASFRIKSRRYCLNHKPFSYRFNVNSEKDTKAVLRIFLGPANEEMQDGTDYFSKYYKYFVLMDKFEVNLKTGSNNIERHSSDSTFSMPDMMSSDVYYKKLQKALAGSEPFTYNEKFFAYPERLTLPKGKPEGMQFIMFFYLSPLDESKTMSVELPIFGKMMFDGKPLGFPLDKPVQPWKFTASNMLFKSVMIYHMKEGEKYVNF